MECLNAINEKIAELKGNFVSQNNIRKSEKDDQDSTSSKNLPDSSDVENKGRIIFDATARPQDIAYPTDLDLLSDAREKSANRGLPASFWCLTWSSWLGRHSRLFLSKCS